MQQIIAMGGGGFTMEPGNQLLDAYVVQQVSKPRPRICFVPTASADNDNYVRRFYQTFCELDCRPSHLSLFQVPTQDLESFVMDHDAIYVGGGNTYNMLVLWRAWELDRIFRLALEEGVVLAGLSAGSVCWFEQCVTDSFTPPGSSTLHPLDCLGYLSGSHCPHYHGEPTRRPEYHRLISESKLGAGWAADDGAALHFVDGELRRVVSSRPAAAAYRVEPGDTEVTERVCDVQYLGETTSVGDNTRSRPQTR